MIGGPLRFLVDEDLDNVILRALVRRRSDLDVVRVQDVGLSGASDSEVLEWAAREGRVLLTHDLKSMPKHAIARVTAGLSMTGIFGVSQSLPIGRVADDILLLAECSREGEWEGQIGYLPL